MEGGFWSSIAKPTAPPRASRAPLDQARMQLIQQLLAAMLNVMMDQFVSGNLPFPDDPTDDGYLPLINEAKTAYCGTNIADILAKKDALDLFNTSGEETPLPPGVDPGADPKTSQAVANKVFWNSLP